MSARADVISGGHTTNDDDNNEVKEKGEGGVPADLHQNVAAI